MTALLRTAFRCSIVSLRHYAKLTSATQNSFLAPKRKFHSIYFSGLTSNGPKNTRNTALLSLIAQKPLTRKYATKTVKVPTLAESIVEGSLSKWNKQIGDFVQQDEEVATIETDKINAPVNSPYSGTILELYANEQDTVT
ncbi:15101_t:CDS:2, partial [Acaulospora morrowiae]